MSLETAVARFNEECVGRPYTREDGYHPAPASDVMTDVRMRYKATKITAEEGLSPEERSEFMRAVEDLIVEANQRITRCPCCGRSG